MAISRLWVQPRATGTGNVKHRLLASAVSPAPSEASAPQAHLLENSSQPENQPCVLDFKVERASRAPNNPVLDGVFQLVSHQAPWHALQGTLVWLSLFVALKNAAARFLFLAWRAYQVVQFLV